MLSTIFVLALISGGPAHKFDPEFPTTPTEIHFQTQQGSSILYLDQKRFAIEFYSPDGVLKNRHLFIDDGYFYHVHDKEKIVDRHPASFSRSPDYFLLDNNCYKHLTFGGKGTNDYRLGKKVEEYTVQMGKQGDRCFGPVSAALVWKGIIFLLVSGEKSPAPPPTLKAVSLKENAKFPEKVFKLPSNFKMLDVGFSTRN